MLTMMSLFSFVAFDKASVFQGYHSTGLCACCNRYGEVSVMSLLAMIVVCNKAKNLVALKTRTYYLDYRGLSARLPYF